MSNLIKLKRGSGSDPQASDLVVGEVAVRTDTGKLFTKKDDNSVTEIGVTALGDDDVTTAKIADDAVTYAKIQNVSATNRILGRDSSGAGVIEEITPANLRTMINVEDGATADQSASEILTLLKTVDGAGSGLDADTLDGISSASFLRSDAADVMSQGTQGTATLDVRNTGGAGSGTGTGALIATFKGDSDAIEVRNIAGGDYGIYNTQQDNGFELYDGSGGVKILYDGNIGVEFDSGNAYGDFKGVPTVNGTNLARVSDDITGNAATATKLAATKNIAGVAFDGSANISLNNNAITNGAGYITSSDSSITNKLPLAGGTLTGNLTLSSTHPKIILTDTNSDPDFQIINNHGNFLVYDSTNARNTFNIDGSGNIQVSGTVDGRDLATDGSKLDGIASGATNVTNTNQLTNGAGFITSADGGNAATLDSLDSSQFLRSDADDTASGIISVSAGLSFGADARCNAAISSLSDSSTINIDFNSGIHHSVTLGGNRSFGSNNTSVCVGQSGSIFITQDGTGSRTASFNGHYKFVGGTAPTLSTAANAVDRIDYVVKASNVIHCAVSLDVK